MIEAVVFDVGETLVDETRRYQDWADWIGVPRLTLMATLGAAIARGREWTDAMRLFRPDFDIRRDAELMSAAGYPDGFTEADLYPDVRRALDRLRDRGLWIGIVGNQPVRTTPILHAMDLPVDYIATSDEWGLRKPDPAFFDRVAAIAPCPRDRLVYVGDRVDNDVVPAKDTGLRSAFLLRGPWAWIQQDSPAAARADWRISALTELPELIDADAA
ncbi:HAD family hydrolase [Nocardia sp. alder85J]|uniref:HAD family hydrolase n=1 Tax=Nocardia sp. alder85J TaxID=2862949 RepID=UPI001CD25BDB|nr:HAD family hydrolase [Nocardia sp. alder85J]MCX4091650.1 HAD family hydrolase [Nocardia sp. alder85J]